MKRWGKSPPPEAQVTGHGKPYRVQGQIGDLGAARSSARKSGPGPGYRPLRQMILSAAQAAQTEFGLQPFRSQYLNVWLRSPVLLGRFTVETAVCRCCPPLFPLAAYPDSDTEMPSPKPTPDQLAGVSLSEMFSGSEVRWTAPPVVEAASQLQRPK